MAVSVLAPDPVLLTCTAAGMPSPDIVWVKQDSSGADTEFSESGRGVMITVEESTAMSTSTLTIPFSDSLDTANYSCEAENSLGTTTSQPAPVNVFGKSETTYVAATDCLCVLCSVQCRHWLNRKGLYTLP